MVFRISEKKVGGKVKCLRRHLPFLCSCSKEIILIKRWQTHMFLTDTFLPKQLQQITLLAIIAAVSVMCMFIKLTLGYSCRCMFTALLTLCDNVIGSCSRCVLSSWAGGADWGCLKSFTCRPTRQEFSKTFSFPTEHSLPRYRFQKAFCLWCSLTLWRLFHQPHAKFPFLPFFSLF